MTKINLEKIKKVSDKNCQEIQARKDYPFWLFCLGKETEDSDFDLLIIKKTKKNFFERCREVAKIIGGEVPVDILVLTPKEIKD